MNKKEIEFYLKFHEGFRKNYNLNSALKSNLLRWNDFVCNGFLNMEKGEINP